VELKPISDSIQKHLDETLSKIPSTKTGTVKFGTSITKDGFGAEVSVAQRWKDFTFGGWGGIDPKNGWGAGAQGQYSW
jgi:hypothetical protein